MWPSMGQECYVELAKFLEKNQSIQHQIQMVTLTPKDHEQPKWLFVVLSMLLQLQ
jgi:hypothetical protein